MPFMARPRASDETRRKLLEEGMEAFLKQGYHGTGLKEVLDRVRVPKGSFYNYFESKEAFGTATIEHYADCVAAKLAAAMDSAPDPLGGLRGFFEREMRAFEAADFVGGCLVGNLGAEIEGSPIIREALSIAAKRYRDGIAEVLRQAQEAGQLRRDISADELAALLVDAWEGAVIRMKIERSLLPLQSCLARLLDGFFKP